MIGSVLASYGNDQLVGWTITFSSSSSASPLTDIILSNTPSTITFATPLTTAPTAGDAFTVSARYYVSIGVDQSHITLNLQNTSMVATAMLVSGTFNDIVAGITASYVVGPPGTVTFGPGIGTFQATTWSSVILTIRNENTAQSGIYQVKAGDLWMSSWKQVSQTGTLITDLGPQISPLVIPAKGTENILLDFSGLKSVQFLKSSSALSFEILSSAGNLFTTTYTPPTSVPTAGSSSENYLITTRDIVTFDGSHSYAGSSDIQSYLWQIDIPRGFSDVVGAGPTMTTIPTTNTYVVNQLAGYTITFASSSTAHPKVDTVASNTANSITLMTPLGIAPTAGDSFSLSECSVNAFSVPSDFDTAYVSAETVQFTPESLFPTTLLTDCVTGPMRATLTVVDASGFSSTSQPTIVAQDQNIAPEAAIALSNSPTCGGGVVSVRVSNIFNQATTGVPVVAFATGAITFTSSTEIVTDTYGMATFTYSPCSSPVTIEFTSGTLPPLFVPIS